MSTPIEFQTPHSREEFLYLFENICGIAEEAFNRFDAELEEIGKNPETIKHRLSYLIGIIKTIRGLRGDSALLRVDSALPFAVQKNGVTYDNDSLYKAEGHLCDRLNNALEILKNIDRESYESFMGLWRY